MKRPLHVWSVFAVCVAVALASITWLTMKAVELDDLEAAARDRQRQLTIRADFEGDVRLALRRMDQYLAELFAEESAWPYFAYQPFYLSDGSPWVAAAEPTGKAGQEASAEPPLASPLMNPQTPFVKLYFQLASDRQLSSPNLPPDRLYQLAEDNGWVASFADRYRQRLAAFRPIVLGPNWASQLPEPQALERDPPVTIAMAGQPHNSPLPPQVRAGPSQAPNPPAQQAADPGDQQVLAQTTVQYDDKRISPAQQVGRGNDEYEQRRRDVDELQTKWNYRLQQRDTLFGNSVEVTAGNLQRSADDLATTAKVAVGRSRPVWSGDQLVLARRVTIGGQSLVQGCWLDWEAIRGELARRVADLLPSLEIAPVHSEADADLTRMFATLPAQILVTVPIIPAAADEPPLSPIRLSLLAAWGCLILAALAVATLLAGVLSLSERRAAFVSAVTHELRTPLTTFRMYAEMLAEGMVPDEARRQDYLNTLRAEADRLFHLIENVLSYARLERGRGQRTKATIPVGDLLAGMQQRLSDRADRADMTLRLDLPADAAAATVHTDAAAIEQIIVNLVDNACKYAATAEDRCILLSARPGPETVCIRVQDHGPGISVDEMRGLFRPFTKSAHQAAHSAPGVGLGLALGQRLARQLGGRLQLEPTSSAGATFLLTLPTSTA